MSDMTDERALDFIRTYLAPYAAHGEKDLVVEHIAARLRAAPQPPAEAQADEVVCMECGQPTMHMGQVCYACSHPAAKPAEAQAQDGGEVELRHMVAKLAAHVRPTCGELWAEAERLLNRTAPPSAPVGVEAGWYRYNKPAPRWEDTKFGEWLDPAVYGPPREQHGYSLEVASLAQQPEADSPSFTAGDMADAAAQGFREGVASVGAEIERLRAERDSFQRVGIREQERAERLAEALRNVRAVGRDDDGDYAHRGEHHATCVAIAERALLRDHDKEGK